MSTTPREAYLERLADLLTAREARRVLPEVDALIQDRIEAERERDPSLDPLEAERRALDAWDSPEALADRLVASPVRIDLATRRAFVRWLAALFAVHLVLSIVLTVAGSGDAAVPGVLGPLPRDPFAATVLGATAVLLFDAGLLLFAFLLLGRLRAGRPLPSFQLEARASRVEGVKGLVLVGLLAVIFNLFLDTIFAIRDGDRLYPLLAEQLRAVVPLVDGVLALFAIRHGLTVAGRGSHPVSLVLDALASAAATALLVIAVTQGQLVDVPEAALGETTARALQSLLERVFLVVLIVAALLFALRFATQALRAWRALER